MGSCCGILGYEDVQFGGLAAMFWKKMLSHFEVQNKDGNNPKHQY